MNAETRTCKNCQQSFTIDPDDFAFYETIHVPPPTWCPQCRMVRRLAWFGYRILHKRDGMITFYHPDSGHAIMPQKDWWSDSWDPKSYGREYDFNRPFFEQWGELFKAVPKPALHTDYSTMIGSEYCNAASDLKNCYLCFKFDRSEECGYINSASILKNCFDCTYANQDELCYEGLNLQHCYQVFFSQDCSDSHDIWFSQDLVGCSNCIGCINLRKQNYCIFNEHYSKDEYDKKLKEFDFGSAEFVKSFKKKTQEFFLKHPRRQFRGRKNLNVSGDYIYNSKNVKNSYWVDDGENVRYGQLLQALHTRNAYDYTSFAFNAEWIYESCWVGLNTNNVKFSFWNYYGHDIEYCWGSHGASNCFGCVGLRKGEYCILNRQYSKEEYQALLPKIKEQMLRDSEYGEFFPVKYSPWAYNETHAYEYLPPLTKEQALAQGFAWRDEDSKSYKPATIDLPDNIKGVDDDILKEILKCYQCGRNYQLIAKELQFLQRFNLCVPRQCPLCRDRARIRQLNPIAIYHRTCANPDANGSGQGCNKDIETSYGPDRPEIVYCESCYQREVL